MADAYDPTAGDMASDGWAIIPEETQAEFRRLVLREGDTAGYTVEVIDLDNATTFSVINEGDTVGAVTNGFFPAHYITETARQIAAAAAAEAAAGNAP